jgi:glycosyltransferase involved in cell wall biosynthesis
LKVSIITPSFNQGQFIERTLASVARQEGAEIEHVVIDGGSTDNTLDILTNFTPSVNWVTEKDRGQTDAVNKGIRATDGDIIGWLNSDDIYYPGAIVQVVNYFQNHPDVDVVYGKADHIDIKDEPFEEYPTEPWDFGRLKYHCFLCQPAVFFRRSVVERYGLLDESLNYCMDYGYWIHLALAGATFGYLETKLAGSRIYPENKTMGSRMKVHREINDMLRNLTGSVPDKWLFNYAHTVVELKMGRAAHKRRFRIALTVHALLAAIRWNGWVSGHMMKTIIVKAFSIGWKDNG